MQRLATLFAFLLAFAPATVLAQSTTFVINEIDYDQPGVDDAEFIELRNVSGGDLSLAGYTLELVDGSEDGSTTIYFTIDLDDVTVPAGDYFVVCNRIINVPGCDQDFIGGGDAGNNAIRNGLYDAIGLRGPGDVLVDAVAYEGTVPGYTEGQSISPGDNGDRMGLSLARLDSPLDTDDNDDDFDGGQATPGFDNEFIPVEFASFAAQLDGADVLLQWTTASEQNNAGFQVQRRVEGSFQDIEGAFVETKASGGNSIEALDYRFRLEGLDAGTHAFRLKQVDFDGAFGYSPSVEVTVAAQMRVSSVSPNPFRTQAQLELSVPTAQDRVTVEVFNVLGQRVALLHDGPMAAGETLRPTLRANGLSSGLYLIRVQGETFSEVRRATLVK